MPATEAPADRQPHPWDKHVLHVLKIAKMAVCNSRVCKLQAETQDACNPRCMKPKMHATADSKIDLIMVNLVGTTIVSVHRPVSTSETTRLTLYLRMVLIKSSLWRPILRKPGDRNGRSPTDRKHSLQGSAAQHSFVQTCANK